jgi:hypothetical protein
MNVAERYHFLVVELAVDHYELAYLKRERTRARVESMTTEPSKTSSEREARADVASVDWHVDVLELEGAIAAKTVELQWCRDLMAAGITEYDRTTPDPESSPAAPPPRPRRTWTPTPR